MTNTAAMPQSLTDLMRGGSSGGSKSPGSTDPLASALDLKRTLDDTAIGNQRIGVMFKETQKEIQDYLKRIKESDLTKEQEGMLAAQLAKFAQLNQRIKAGREASSKPAFTGYEQYLFDDIVKKANKREATIAPTGEIIIPGVKAGSVLKQFFEKLANETDPVSFAGLMAGFAEFWAHVSKNTDTHYHKALTAAATEFTQKGGPLADHTFKLERSHDGGSVVAFYDKEGEKVALTPTQISEFFAKTNAHLEAAAEKNPRWLQGMQLGHTGIPEPTSSDVARADVGHGSSPSAPPPKGGTAPASVMQDGERSATPEEPALSGLMR